MIKLYKMKIIKSIIATIFFIIFTQLIGIWTVIVKVIDNPELITDYYIFITGLIEVFVVMLLLFKLVGYGGVISQKTSYVFLCYCIRFRNILYIHTNTFKYILQFDIGY